MTLAVRDHYLCALDFTDGWLREEAKLARRFGALDGRRAEDPAGVVSRLKRYFAGSVEALAEIQVDPGGTQFQRKVWAKLCEVLPGQTISYRDLACLIGSPSAVRAVGAANGANPIAIVIPCHRVIGADGRLVGYGGGIERKRWLLMHERAHCAESKGALASEVANRGRSRIVRV
jgi:methylated-DNA-[protein]-cysteine S-methyltransferase